MNILKHKTDMRGFSHDIVIVVFVVGLGLFGTLYLVFAHAATATIKETGNLSSGLSNSAGKVMCLDDYKGGTANNSPVYIYPCSKTDSAQIWSLYSDNTIRIKGKCLDVYQQGTANGSKIGLFTCNGGSNQKWTVGSNPAMSLNNLVGTQSGKCLDVYTSQTANNSKTDLWTCDDTTAQVWGWNTGSTIVAGGATAGANCNYMGGFGEPNDCYMQVGAYQNGVAATGVSANLSQAAPYCGPGCGHSLTQLQVFGGPNTNNIIEYGWNVPQDSPQGTPPQLGIGLWANGSALDADANFVQVSKTVLINEVLSATATGSFKIQFVNNQWQIIYKGTEVGYFPESIWTSRGTSLTSLKNIYIYGEVLQPALTVADMQMGNGKLGTSTGAATVSGYTLYGTTTAPLLVKYDWGKAPAYDESNLTATGFSYGGPGV